MDATRPTLELPADVRVKLRKLEKLESRYQELLRSYRIAHARVQTIDLFETSLRENTPLTSISDPNALLEYLNQVNLKGDMVLDELKRVSSERDSYKQRLDEAERKTREAWDEVAKRRVDEPTGEGQKGHLQRVDEADRQDLENGDPLGATKKSPTTSVKSPTVTIPGMSMFSPRLKSLASPKSRQGSEDLFSYDSEIPRMEGELQAKQEKIVELETDVQKLKTDLAVTRESTQSMVQTLEEATREVNTLRDNRDRSEADAKEQKESLKNASDKLRVDLEAAGAKLQQLEERPTSESSDRIEELTGQLKQAYAEVKVLRTEEGEHEDKTKQMEELQHSVDRLKMQLTEAQAERQRGQEKIATLQETISTLRIKLKDAEDRNRGLLLELDTSSKPIQESNSHKEMKELSESATIPIPSETANIQDMLPASKKRNKKKKKGGKPDMETSLSMTGPPKSVEQSPGGQIQGSLNVVSNTEERLHHELQKLRVLLTEKDNNISTAQSKLKDQEGLREEIETLRDDLINVGQEHVEVKDKVKQLLAEKGALEQTVVGLEKELAEARGAHKTATAGSEQKQKDLATQFEDLKIKSTALQTDLSAAQQLASSRFKDLNDLRNVLQKAQPEINALKSEAAEMRVVREALTKKEADFKRLDSRHEEMRSETARLKQAINAREAEIQSLNQINAQETSVRAKAEETSTKTQQELSRLEAEKRQASDSLDRVSRELGKVREELATHKVRLRDLEQQFSKHRSDSEGLREEIELKTAQYASAQSLMASMRDQTAEMAIQTKEARDRCESLDEEVADAHRLLSERSREGETMRRLLADVEGRADARTREMKERMDTAIEERDRAEEEASTAGRRRARELEDLRNKYRDLERSAKRAQEDKEELEIAQRDWKRRREEFEYRAGLSTHELEEVKKALGELRDALDESEKQTRDLEKQKAELRRSVEDTQHRLEKLQKSNKVR